MINLGSDSTLFGSDGLFSDTSKDNVGYGKFRNPWRDFASRLMPRNVKSSLYLAEFLWYANPTFARASSLIARYFITELEFKSKDDQKITDYKQLFYDTLDVINLLAYIGDDFMCYGNGFISMILPFDRNLQCPTSGNLFPLTECFKNNFCVWTNNRFKKTKEGAEACDGNWEDFEIRDTPSQDINRLIVKRWNPHEIEIAKEPFTGKKVFYWTIPADIKKAINSGHIETLAVVPKEIIDAATTDGAKFKFGEGQMFHACDSALAGVETGGWGLPSIIKVFRLMYRSQLLDRYDEAINLDYIIGLRVITPAKGGTGSPGTDPIKSMGMDVFSSHVRRMIERHRMDPTTWHTSPTPLDFQHMGAEGAQLTAVDIKKETDDKILNAVGIPADLFRFNLKIEAAPLALRLFEQSWPQIQGNYNKFLTWLSEGLTKNFKQKSTSVVLTKPTLIDDTTIRDVMLQLMSGQQVSPQTALKRLGIGDYREEVRKTLESDRIRTEEQRDFDEQNAKEQKFQEFKDELSAQGQQQPGPGGQPPMGNAAGAMQGAPPAAPGGPMTAEQLVPDPNAISSPQGIENEANRIAQQLLVMEPSARRSSITSLTKTYSTLAGVVKETLRKLEQQAAQTGVNLTRTGQLPPPQM